MSSKIGIMQGRLSKSVNGKIQSFPINSWKKEFYLAKEIGFELIEWVLDDDLQNNPILNKKAFPEIESLKNDTGIDINSICCDYFMKNSLSPNSKSFKKKNLEIFDLLIKEICPKNNIKIIDLPLMGVDGLKDKKISEDYQNLFSSLEKELLANNLIIAIENDLNPEEFENFLKNVNKKIITVNYDMGNSAYREYNMRKEFLSYGQSISNVHIKDCTPKDYTVPLGSGNVDFDGVFQLLKNNNYKENFILQAARGKDDIQTAKEQLNFIKVFISKYFQ